MKLFHIAASTTSRSTREAPAFPRSLSHREPPRAAPPLISTSPVVRTQDFAQLHPNASNENLSTAATDAASPRSPIRIRDHSGTNSHHNRYRHNGSGSSFARFRRPSLTGSFINSSPGSVNNLTGAAYDATQIPGFSIADDVRSIRTVDTTTGYTGMASKGRGRHDREHKEGQVSVAKLIRRLRGEGLRWVHAIVVYEKAPSLIAHLKQQGVLDGR